MQGQNNIRDTQLVNVSVDRARRILQSMITCKAHQNRFPGDFSEKCL